MPRIAQIGALIAALFITLGAGSLHAREPAPLAAYGALPDVEDAAISPSGTMIAFLTTVEGAR